MAVGMKKYKDMIYFICQVDLRIENPIAERFLHAMEAYQDI